MAFGRDWKADHGIEGTIVKKTGATPDTFRTIFDFYDAPVMHVDCGEKCRAYNDGIPVCCDTRNAVPIMQKSEWRYLRSRSKLWHAFKPYDAATRNIVEGLHSDCKAVECLGPAKCERDNRSLACRAFPFFPYFTKDREILGLSYVWQFEDRCWVIGNMKRVEQSFVDQTLKAFDTLFQDDPAERGVFTDFSASMRRVFSRQRRPIPVIGPKRDYYLVLPKGAGIRKVGVKEFSASTLYPAAGKGA